MCVQGALSSPETCVYKCYVVPATALCGPGFIACLRALGRMQVVPWLKPFAGVRHHARVGTEHPVRCQIGETYDWRLAVPNMERRDGYFTRLKVRVETMHKIHGEKVRLHGQHSPTLPPLSPLASTCCSRASLGGVSRMAQRACLLGQQQRLAAAQNGWQQTQTWQSTHAHDMARHCALQESLHTVEC